MQRCRLLIATDFHHTLVQFSGFSIYYNMLHGFRCVCFYYSCMNLAGVFWHAGGIRTKSFSVHNDILKLRKLVRWYGTNMPMQITTIAGKHSSSIITYILSWMMLFTLVIINKHKPLNRYEVICSLRRRRQVQMTKRTIPKSKPSCINKWKLKQNLENAMSEDIYDKGHQITIADKKSKQKRRNINRRVWGVIVPLACLVTLISSPQQH